MPEPRRLRSLLFARLARLIEAALRRGVAGGAERCLLESISAMLRTRTRTRARLA